MRYRTFLVWNATGGLIWGAGCVAARLRVRQRAQHGQHLPDLGAVRGDRAGDRASWSRCTFAAGPASGPRASPMPPPTIDAAPEYGSALVADVSVREARAGRRRRDRPHPDRDLARSATRRSCPRPSSAGCRSSAATTGVASGDRRTAVARATTSWSPSSSDCVVGFTVVAPADDLEADDPDPATDRRRSGRCWSNRAGAGAGTARGCWPPRSTSPAPTA